MENDVSPSSEPTPTVGFVHRLWHSRMLRVFVLVLLSIVCVILFLVDVIPPKALTVTRMWVTKSRILIYARINSTLPADLSALPDIPEKDCKTVDYWGRPIHFIVGADGTVTLMSLGSDGKVGGTGDAADIIRRFPAKQADGRWSDESVDWLREKMLENTK